MKNNLYAVQIATYVANYGARSIVFPLDKHYLGALDFWTERMGLEYVQ